MSRSFNAPFIAEKNKVADGPTPYNIIEFGFATPILVSDRGLPISLAPVPPLTVVSVYGNYRGITVDELTGDVYTCIYLDDIYKLTAGEESAGFVSMGTSLSGSQFEDIEIDPITKDIYVVISGVFPADNIFKQTGGEESVGFVSIGIATSANGVSVNRNTGDIWVSRGAVSGGISKLTAGEESAGFVSVQAISRVKGISVDQTTGDVYAVTELTGVGALYKLTAGEESAGFLDIAGPALDWEDVCNDGVYVYATSLTDEFVYQMKIGEEAGGFIKWGTVAKTWAGLDINSVTKELWACAILDYVYKAEAAPDIWDPAPTNLIKSWSFLDSNLGYVSGRSIINIPALPEFQVTLVNTGDPRFTDNITTADPIEGVEVILYQSFEGLASDKKEILFKGVVRGKVLYNEFECTLNIKGIWQKYNRIIGEELLVSEDDYPSCDPDDVGKMQNIIYGSVDHAPCLALDAGGVDNLASTITAIQTTLPLVDATKFRTAGNGKLGIELISWMGKSANTLTGVTRGAGAAASVEGSVVFEVLTNYIYQLASHPVKNVNDIYVDNFLVNNVATKYTGKTGDELTGYEGLAVVSLPSLVSRANSIALLEANGMTNADATAAVATVSGSASLTISDIIALFKAMTTDEGSHAHTLGEVIVVWKLDNVISFTPTIAWTNFGIDSDFSTACQLVDSTADVTYGKSFYEDYPGPPTYYRSCINLRSDHVTVQAAFDFLNATVIKTTPGTSKTSWVAVNASHDTWAEMNNQTGRLFRGASGGTQCWVAQAWVEMKYTPDAPASAATNVLASWLAGVTKGVDKSTLGEKGGNVTRTGVTNLSGNSVASVEVGVLVTIDCDGVIDDDSAETLLVLPNDIIQHILTNYCSFPLADIGASFATSGTFFAGSAQNYSFAFIINKRTQAEDLLSSLSVQCRSRFYVTTYGTAELVVRQLAQASTHSIPKSEIAFNSMEIFRSSEEDIVNTFNIRFDKDWRLFGDDAYKRTSPFSDVTSVVRYGIREPSNDSTFDFFAVKDTLMMFDVGDFWLSLLKISRVIPSFTVFLDNLEIEAGDYIDITHPLDNMTNFVVEVLSTRHILGSATREEMDSIELSTLQN